MSFNAFSRQTLHLTSLHFTSPTFNSCVEPSFERQSRQNSTITITYIRLSGILGGNWRWFHISIRAFKDRVPHTVNEMVARPFCRNIVKIVLGLWIISSLLLEVCGKVKNSAGKSRVGQPKLKLAIVTLVMGENTGNKCHISGS
jgi:hypothetical protein